jgi:hypothetical protein
MQRAVVAAVGGLLLGVAMTSLVFLTRPHRAWQEQEARAEASGLACGLSVGLNRSCARILVFRSIGSRAWLIRIGGPGGHLYCYELRTFRSPQRRACH